MVSKSVETSNQPSLRERRKAETRAALLSAAFVLCAEQGLEGPSIDDIAAKAGFTKGAFYASFESKQDLFMAMLDDRFAPVIAALDETLAGDDPAAEAVDAANAFLRAVNDAPGGPGLFFQFVAFAVRDDGFRRRFAERYDSLHQRVTDIYARWTRDFPERPAVPLEQIAMMSCAISNGFLLEQRIDPSLDDELHGWMHAIFFRGIQAVTAGWEPMGPGGFEPPTSRV
jgi:AcrR family transcriptional regulator